jgi:truncated hemoglobin YjbI
VIAPYDEITGPTIRALVDGFYVRGRRGPMPGPIFTNAIAEGAWPAQPKKIYAFWPPVLLTRGRLKSNPVSARRKIANVVPFFRPDWTWSEDLRRHPKVAGTCV